MSDRTGLRLGVLQEQRLRAWPTARIRPKSVALGVLSLLAEVSALRAERDRLIDGIGRIAERRMGLCPLCLAHWNEHAETCPVRFAQQSAQTQEDR